MGRSNASSLELREFSKELIDDPEYRRRLRIRLINGDLSAQMEVTLWHYRFGKPVDRAELTFPEGIPRIHDLSDEELLERYKERVAELQAMRKLDEQLEARTEEEPTPQAAFDFRPAN